MDTNTVKNLCAAHNARVRAWRYHGGLANACREAGIPVNDDNTISADYAMRAMSIDWEKTREFYTAAKVFADVVNWLGDHHEVLIDAQTGELVFQY